MTVLCFFDGKEMNNLQPKDRNVSMVFQNYALYPHLNVYGNLAFGLKMQRVPKAEIEQRVQEIARILEITPYLKRKPKELSGGQRQRVAMGRALVRETQVLLLDEPLSNLDAQLRVQMRSEILALHKRIQRTIVYVTHDQVEAMTMGDRVAVMHDGILQQIGKPMEIFNQPANTFVAGFIGTPPMNLLNCQVVKRGDDYFAQAEDFAMCITGVLPNAILDKQVGKPSILGIRPESIALAESADKTTMTVRVDLVENLGSARQIVGTFADKKITVKTKSNQTVKYAMELPLWFEKKKICIFDQETEKNILYMD